MAFIVEAVNEFDAMRQRAEAAGANIDSLRETVIAARAEFAEMQHRAEAAEARQWQNAGLPCPSCGEDAVRVSADPVNEDYAIERRVYHCLECERAWVKVRVLATLSAVPHP